MTRSIGRRAFPAILALIIALPVAGGWSAVAQAAGDANDQTPSEEELDQQMRAAGVQIFVNMLAQGINPGDFMAQVFSEMPPGGFDPDFLKEKLIEKNLIDRDTAERLQAGIQRVAGSRLQRDLEVTDAEWKVMLPRIQKVLDTGYAAGVRNPQLSMIGLRPKNNGQTEVEKALLAVQAATKDPNASPAAIKQKLAAWRAAKEKGRADYVEAQKQLIEICTRRQEAVFTALGLVE